jgi:hypothetical protein
MLWAWSGGSTLRALPRDAGVAFLARDDHRDVARECHPASPSAAVRRATTPRWSPLTRIETPAGRRARQPGGRDRPRHRRDHQTATRAGVQVDFDATLSQRPMYRSLSMPAAGAASLDAALDHRARVVVHRETGCRISRSTKRCRCCSGWVRRKSRTATASMDRLRAPLPRRGRHLARRTSIPPWSRDERRRDRGRRVYVFNPRPWTDATVAGRGRCGHESFGRDARRRLGRYARRDRLRRSPAARF